MLSGRPSSQATFIKPCLPRSAKEPPAGSDWVHEIKHDGFRIMARRDGGRVRLYTRNGYDCADRFGQVVQAIFKHACALADEQN
jgi:bifunctional non-homologous end joining protein LigD